MSVQSWILPLALAIAPGGLCRPRATRSELESTMEIEKLVFGQWGFFLSISGVRL